LTVVATVWPSTPPGASATPLSNATRSIPAVLSITASPMFALHPCARSQPPTVTGPTPVSLPLLAAQPTTHAATALPYSLDGASVPRLIPATRFRSTVPSMIVLPGSVLPLPAPETQLSALSPTPVCQFLPVACPTTTAATVPQPFPDGLSVPPAVSVTRHPLTVLSTTVLPRSV
jgi:hypothetical protein